MVADQWTTNYADEKSQTAKTQIQNITRQEGPPIGGAVRNTTSLIPQRLSFIMLLSLAPKTFLQYPVSTDRDNNTASAIIMRLEYNHCNEK